MKSPEVATEPRFPENLLFVRLNTAVAKLLTAGI
jgi:hypothetical protein